MNRLSRCLVAAVLLACGSAASSQDEPSEAALAAINTAIAEVRAEIAERDSERASVYRSLQETERNLEAINSDIANLEQEIGSNEARLEALRREENALEARKTEQQTLLKQYVRSSFQTGRQEYFRLLLNQENPARVSRTLGYYRYFSAARSRAIEDFNTTLTDLQTVREQVSLTTGELVSQQASLESRRESQQASLRERRTLLDNLDVLLATSAQKLESLEAERGEMELLLAELRRSIANLALGEHQQPFAGLRGRLPWPVDGNLRNRWGASVGLGDLNWEGVTIAAAAGSDVKAIHHGRVVFSDWFSSSGLLLIIDHGEGYMSLYAHNQALYKEVGEWVYSGESIAAVGDTGGQGETGLYFEIRHNGSSENPATWLLARN